MTIVEGQIEPLKRLKETLSEAGITRFNSIADINAFLKNYEAEKRAIPTQVERAIDREVQNMRASLAASQTAHSELQLRVKDELNQELTQLQTERDRVETRRNRNLLAKLFLYPAFASLKRKTAKLENSIDKLVAKQTNDVEASAKDAENTLDAFIKNKDVTTAERVEKSAAELGRTKSLIDELYPLIAGAVGEAAVVNALEKLSDEHYLINDFSVEFDPPIFNRKEDDRIFSVQIDHLLICPSGVFLIETKNWSKQSVQDLDLRSPVEQIRRSGYALFVLLNSDSGFSDVKLDNHHWGKKKISIRNIIAMTNAKPKAEFRHVKILALDELTGYIEYFEPMLSNGEVKGIFDYLK